MSQGSTRPQRAVASTWCVDPDFGSAYSYLRPGATPAAREALAATVAPGLALAGEYNWAEHPGTMHGAWFSGERAARLIGDPSAVPARPPAESRALVVGAGLAGLSAARTLRSLGWAVTVLEASGVAGGRATADRRLGVPVHLGAAWIHGVEGNPIAAACREAGVRYGRSGWGHRRTIVVGRGPLSAAELRRLDALHGVVDARISAAAAAARADSALGPVVADAIASVCEDPVDRRVLSSWIRSEYEGMYAAPLRDLSLVYRSEPFLLPGDNVTVLDGLDTVIAHLAQGLDVRLRCRARSVELREGRWAVETDSGVFAADAVVVAVPIGALQNGRIAFVPSLPTPLLDALHRIGPGRVAKVVATFPRAWWPGGRSFAVVADPPFPLPGWFDMSELTGVPTLASFGTADAVDLVERMPEADLIDLVHGILQHAEP